MSNDDEEGRQWRSPAQTVENPYGSRNRILHTYIQRNVQPTGESCLMCKENGSTHVLKYKRSEKKYLAYAKRLRDPWQALEIIAIPLLLRWNSGAEYDLTLHMAQLVSLSSDPLANTIHYNSNCRIPTSFAYRYLVNSNVKTLRKYTNLLR